MRVDLPEQASIIAKQLVRNPTLYIDGEWVAGAGTPFPVIDPTQAMQLGEINGASTVQVEQAIMAARRSFDGGTWSRATPESRAEVLVKLHHLMVEHQEALIEIFITEGGCPRSLARTLNMEGPIESLRWIADKAARGPAGGWVRTLNTDPWAKTRGLVQREGYGVVTALTPYNVPYIAYVWKVAMALAAGCSVVLLPSPRAQLTALAFMRLVEQAGVPAGIANLVFGGPDIGRILTSHDAVDMVTFTGSNAVGADVMRQGAATSKKVLLELGGKSPNIVLPGVNPADVAAASLRRLFRNAGQGCAVTSRTLVPRESYDTYVEAARVTIPDIPIGDPWLEETWVGPLIRDDHRARVEQAVHDEVGLGARILAGGGPTNTSLGGYFMTPVLLGNLDNNAPIAQTELFGPVGVLIPYDSIDEAIGIANQTRYGLNANIWGDEEQAIAVALRIQSGNVAINGGGPQRADIAFGGYKQSGIGGEGGDSGFEEFLEFKHIIIPA
ncbi:MAG: aldehyde dehydrogenase family protein [Sphingomonadaceae bacterium]|nr:aldehyde dehydrogenase family protein [Sphingomonadaceae bacterium]